MGQKFYASPTDTFEFANGAIGHNTGAGAFDCLGPYAKVRNCPIRGTDKRLTCYATGYANTYFSIPACTKVQGQYVGGYFVVKEWAIEFVPLKRFHAILGITDKE